MDWIKKVSIGLDVVIALTILWCSIEFWLWGLPYSDTWGNLVSTILALLMIDRIVRKVKELS